ncbi:neural Wiskott-Aldrich syndrome protein isoform X2 [Parambassis ranga]|uniref:Neural Wiskott-Aldrich syndrome protein isoform X2 n=1 Tax=Parambassis ranga TaxID=210632 RepID=A0A6P7IA86_9TELE|nr:neural Wiskott-Aldrich syndrome protein-like isoform X2 [Parambassis ranga]
MAASLVSGCQAMSDLLTIREKGVLVGLLDPQCKLIKSTVAQVLQAKGSLGWSRFDCGVVCLVEDESVKSYFLRLYCVKRAKLLWEQELYVPFKYTATLKFFHTFPADTHQAGLNFANEVEAEEFYQSVTAVHEMMTGMIEVTSTKTFDSLKNDPSEPGNDTVLSLEEKNHHPTAPPTTSSFKDLDPAMRRLLMQARLTEGDLKDKDIAEAVDCIINKFGGLKAVQRELRNRGSVSQTLPRSAGASISLALRKGPLPPVPSAKHSSTSQQRPQSTDTADQGQVGSWIPGVMDTERIRKSASFKHVGSSAPAAPGDHILTALKEVFRQKQMLQRCSSQLDPDTNKGMHL